MAPSERCLHAMVCLDDGQIVVFGGLGAADHGLNDVHVLDLLDTVSWRKPEVTGTIPSPRWNCVVGSEKIKCLSLEVEEMIVKSCVLIFGFDRLWRG
jgi:hypothetical protein